jgi:hypothetical protein
VAIDGQSSGKQLRILAYGKQRKLSMRLTRVIRQDSGPTEATVDGQMHPRATSMTIDKHTGTVYVTEFLTGRIVAISNAP